jgi:phosphatidylserine/phosphatidylglycerophosphate/cardiolipin synthase-like enzyme/NAD(P)H-flavin reductase
MTIPTSPSTIMQQVIESAAPVHNGGTVPPNLLHTINAASSIETAVGGEEIFQLISRAARGAQREILIQTFAYEPDTTAVAMLRTALEEIAEDKLARQAQGESVLPLRLYLLIDERGTLAHYVFTGHKKREWPQDPESLGLIHRPGLVEVYVGVNRHNSLGGNHAKTVVVDGTKLVITGGNFQSSNFGHRPAHDAAWKLEGPVAQSARADFIEMWRRRADTQTAAPAPILDTVHTPLLNGRSVHVLFATRLPNRMRRWTPLDNPQNCAFQAALSAAQKIVKIATPNLNAPFLLAEISHLVNERGVKVQLLLGKGFNASREASPGMGGTNQATVNGLYASIPSEKWPLLDIRWFSLDGSTPVIGNVAGACHLKFMAVDKQLTIVGNANLDRISTSHLHEANVVIDDSLVTRNITRSVFKEVFARAVSALPSDGYKDLILEGIGFRGWEEVLGDRYAVTIEQIIDEGAGYRRIRLSRPGGFQFQPGQYVEVRSGGIMSRATGKAPAILAIASGANDPFLEVVARPSVLPWHPNHCLGRTEGQQIQIVGPLGTSFPMEQIKHDTRVVLIGGGSGLTAIRSVMRSLPTHSNLQLIYSAKTSQDLMYSDEVNRWIDQGHVICLTQEKQCGFAEGRVTEYLPSDSIAESDLVFICGPQGLVKDSILDLKKKGVSETQIFVSLPYGAKQGGPVYRSDHPRVNR